MGQAAHPNGTRVNSIQVADVSLGWLGSEFANYTQSYALSLLFKNTRHWLSAGFLAPYENIWLNYDNTKILSLRNRKAVKLSKYAQRDFPIIEWDNNLPLNLRLENPNRVFDGIVIRYFRQTSPRLIIKDSVGDLVRPILNLRRPRYAYTY